jgi:transcription initiation factor TFIIH subunit 1
MTSSEDVLLEMANVKHKKDDGRLYLMSERLAWIQGNKDIVTVSHKYADVKSQKISPEGKPKIQLQIVLHDNTTYTFHFVNPEGQPAQFRDRDQVKELLIQLLPKFKRKVNQELEEKNKLLSENPKLLRLYKVSIK